VERRRSATEDGGRGNTFRPEPTKTGPLQGSGELQVNDAMMATARVITVRPSKAALGDDL
jgi:hypothetical protein